MSGKVKALLQHARQCRSAVALCWLSFQNDNARPSTTRRNHPKYRWQKPLKPVGYKNGLLKGHMIITRSSDKYKHIQIHTVLIHDDTCLSCTIIFM